jgi:cullin 3
LNARSPEFISLFVDDKLRKGLKGVNEEDVEVVLDKVMMLFRYLQEKDVFEKYYKQHLAKRLLSGKTVSDDAERSLIVKLKTECGYQFTSKLEGMFTDMKTSRDTMQGFTSMLAASSEGNEGPTLAVQVLTTGSWPTQTGARCNLPKEILAVCDKFKAYYLSTHTGRRLTWQTNMGTADLKATFGKGQKHELNVSTYQMCILILFNTADRLSYRDIEEATDIPAPDLKRCLQSLACVKGRNVLGKEPMSKDIGEEDDFYFNEKFSSKFYKVKIGTVAAQKETEPEKQETRQRVEEDRKPQIEAAIVRIMKARRVLDHNNIVAEVTKQLQSRFLPNPAVIKKRIESLIEREFLERDKTDRKLYRYLA